MQVVSITNIKPNPSNPRLIKDDKFKKLVQSLKDFPEMANVRPIVVNQDMVILGGNMRFKAMKEAKWKEIPVEIVDWDEAKQREFIIKDNVGFGEWDWDDLANNWDAEELDKWGLDVPQFEAEQLEAEEDNYEMPDEVQTDIVIGDLFEIGEHRLLCGSSTEADAVVKLLNGKEPYLMVTDPPYGVKYDADWRNDALREDGSTIGDRAIGKVKNDDKADWTEAWALSPSKVAYVYHAGVMSGIVQKSLEDCDFNIRSQIIWVKSNFAISRADYHWKHEPCWYAVKKGVKGNWASDRKQTTVWEIAKPSKSETGHSTQKPVECMAKAIANHDGDVHDPFLGSGTTMVAAHQLNRKCYGMELDPKYCQVIIDRMLKLDPTLQIKRNGQPYLTEGTNQRKNTDAEAGECHTA
jgi:DNA modification methylase